MSTRCNVVIIDSEDIHYMYHHCDGYLEGVGRELKEFITTCYSPKKFSAQEFEKQLNNWDDSYELDSEIHGDVEYIYTISLSPETYSICISVTALNCTKNPDGTWSESWKEIPEFSKKYSLYPNEVTINNYLDPTTILYHNEFEIGLIKNATALNDVLAQIRVKRDKGEDTKGYYLMWNEQKIEILPSGKIPQPPEGFYDSLTKSLRIIFGLT